MVQRLSACTSLKKATVLANVNELCSGAFMNCTALEEVILSDAITVIGSEAFRNCTALTTVNITDSVTTIERGAFFNCLSLTELRLGKSIKLISGYAIGFIENLEEIEGVISKPLLNENFTVYGYLGTGLETYAKAYVDMYGKNIKVVALGRVNAVADQEFSDYEYEIIPDGIVVGYEKVVNEETGEETLVPITKDAVKILSYKGNATIVVVPETLAIGDLYVVEIAEGAFKNNATVEVIILPKWLTTIGNEAFAGCTALKELIFEDTGYKLPEDAEQGAIAGELVIGTDVIKDSTGVTVYASGDSYVASVASTLGWTYSPNVPDYTPEPELPETPVVPEAPENPDEPADPENPENTPEGGENADA